MSRSHQIPSSNPFPGNTRVSFDQTGKVLQDNSNYPFGMGLGEALTRIHNTYNENKYLYNGNPDSDQGQDDFGLGWYEFGISMRIMLLLEIWENKNLRNRMILPQKKGIAEP